MAGVAQVDVITSEQEGRMLTVVSITTGTFNNNNILLKILWPLDDLNRGIFMRFVIVSGCTIVNRRSFFKLSTKILRC